MRGGGTYCDYKMIMLRKLPMFKTLRPTVHLLPVLGTHSAPHCCSLLIRITKTPAPAATSPSCLPSPSLDTAPPTIINWYRVSRSIGWRLGLQALTGIVFTTFILGKDSWHQYIYGRYFLDILFQACFTGPPHSTIRRDGQYCISKLRRRR